MEIQNIGKRLLFINSIAQVISVAQGIVLVNTYQPKNLIDFSMMVAVSNILGVALCLKLESVIPSNQSTTSKIYNGWIVIIMQIFIVLLIVLVLIIVNLQKANLKDTVMILSTVFLTVSISIVNAGGAYDNLVQSPQNTARIKLIINAFQFAMCCLASIITMHEVTIMISYALIAITISLNKYGARILKTFKLCFKYQKKVKMNSKIRYQDICIRIASVCSDTIYLSCVPIYVAYSGSKEDFPIYSLASRLIQFPTNIFLTVLVGLFVMNASRDLIEKREITAETLRRILLKSVTYIILLIFICTTIICFEPYLPLQWRRISEFLVPIMCVSTIQIACIPVLPAITLIGKFNIELILSISRATLFLIITCYLIKTKSSLMLSIYIMAFASSAFYVLMAICSVNAVKKIGTNA